MPNVANLLMMVVLFSITAAACGSGSGWQVHRPVTVATFPAFDTTISLAAVSPAIRVCETLTVATAKKILSAHFRRRGYLIAGEEGIIPENTVAEEMEAEYDTLFPAYLNSDEYVDGIISYWLAPHGASGTCWQPHTSVIVSTSKGYQLTDEDFIPSSFSVDNVVTQNGQVLILADDCDCANHVIRRKVKIHIQ